MRFSLEERSYDWLAVAPVRLERRIPLDAGPERVFDRLADLAAWDSWFTGMRRVRIDGPSSGAGALRTVWVGPARAQERITGWEPGRRLTLSVVGSNSPGLRAMVEDWQLAPAGSGTLLTLSVGVEPAGVMRIVPWLARTIVGRLTAGATGLAGAMAENGPSIGPDGAVPGAK